MRIIIALGSVSLAASLVVSGCSSNKGSTEPSTNAGGPATDCVGAVTCPTPACGPTPVATCVNSAWTCPLTGHSTPCEQGAVDAAAPAVADGSVAADGAAQNPDNPADTDAAATDGAVADAADAADASTVIPCGSSSCDSTTQYCRIDRQGSGLPEAGSTINSTNYECAPFPSSCSPNVTCACIAATDGCSCGDEGGIFSTQCVYIR